MPPLIVNLAEIDLSPEAELVLQRIFAGYKSVNIIKEFTRGLSGSRVLEVRPIRLDGTPELPTVVKLAAMSMIQQEWRAYQQHIHNRIPQVAAAGRRPTLLAKTGWGGLRYPFVGSDDDDIISLRDFCRQPDVGAEELQAVLERLLRMMDNVWGYHHAAPGFALQPSYEPVLPPGLLLQGGPPPQGAPAAGRSPAAQLRPGDYVTLSDFVVRRVDQSRRTVTLSASQIAPGAPGTARVHIPQGEPMPSYRAQEVVERIGGTLLDTREGRLRAEAAALFPAADLGASEVSLLGHASLPNPLAALPRLLGQTRLVNVATIHGDFNLENILVTTQRDGVSLIDFADARQDHVLHDLLHLETELVTKILPEVVARHGLDPGLVLASLSWRLHRVMLGPAYERGLPCHPALHKPWVALRAIRRAARRYLFDAGDLGEYYQGLALYMLGALRYQALAQRPEHPLPKQMAFWSAALACLWLDHADSTAPPPALGEALARARPLWPAEHHAAAGDEVAGGQLDPEALLAALPVAELPPLAPVPPGSRMLLERNRRFVGRGEQLRRLAEEIKGEGRAVVIDGLGGVGKTQLACEFAYRYGRFFAGGVFWLSCADPQAMPAEIAACGEPGAMGLRPTFRELPLNEQVRLVIEAWESPLPRLLIFDNCEHPELLARWLPPGGCRALVTSRRGNWQADLGLPSLSLDVLRRPESLALLREHQPDAEGGVLDAIAGELGDLPLALHLAGSYLARYRHSVDAASYLSSLRGGSPLRHESLKAGSLSPTEHDPHVARTFGFSYDQLAQHEPVAGLARTLIHGAACLAPGEPIPASLARLALAAQHGQPADIVRAGLQLGGAVDYLIDLGLVRAEANRSLWVHRLVVEFVRDRLGERLGQVQTAVERAICGEAERMNAGRDPAQLRAMQIHLRYAAERAALRADGPAADICHALAEHLYQVGDYQGAQIYHERALSIRRELWGAAHPATAASLTQLGKVLLFYGDIAHAEPYLREALAILDATLGDHNDTATTLNHLGFALQRQGIYEEARRCHERALHIRRAVLSPDHPAAVDSLCNLAYVEYRQGNFGAALAFLQEALEMQRRATGDEHPETARVLTNLGELYVDLKDAAAAADMLGRALAIQSRELGVEHPETARILLGLGDVLRLSGDVAGARRRYQHALDIFRVCHGADHARTRWAQRQLAAISASSPGS